MNRNSFTFMIDKNNDIQDHSYVSVNVYERVCICVFVSLGISIPKLQLAAEKIS